MFTTQPLNINKSVESLANELGDEKPPVDTSSLFSGSENTETPPPPPNKKTPPPSAENEEDEGEPLDAEGWSGFIVDGLEQFNTTFLLKTYESQVLKDVDAELLQNVLAKLETQKSGAPVQIQPKEATVMKKMLEVKKYAEKCTFPEKKKLKLVKSFKRYIESLNIANNLTPGQALLATLAMIQGPIILPVAVNYATEKFNASEIPTLPGKEDKK